MITSITITEEADYKGVYGSLLFYISREIILNESILQQT